MHRWWDDLFIIWVIMRRELVDQLRDWRIVFPLVGFTLFFPLLMLFTARRMVTFVEQYGANILAERLFPFLILVTGFFPLTISLVIALESFAGERERSTIEPLLLAPIRDAHLYLGKLLAVALPPLMAGYLGIAAYLGIMAWRIHWVPDLMLVVMSLLVTAAQALVMVSAAVMISTQATSVRAANLLASAVVIPVALLLQSESMLMFWRRYNALWFYILGMGMTAVVLIRTGLAHFHRENLLGRDLDILTFGWFKRVFLRTFLGKARGLREWYRTQVWPEIRSLLVPALVTLVLLAAAGGYGYTTTALYFAQAPSEGLRAYLVEHGSRMDTLATLARIPLSTQTLFAGAILAHNVRVLLLAAGAALFTFGVAGMLILMLPMALLGGLLAVVQYAGWATPWQAFVALVLPHGVVEIPAMILFGASLLRLGAYWITPHREKTLGTVWVEGLAQWAKIFLAVVLPLFLVAALLEAHLTPRVAMAFLRR